MQLQTGSTIAGNTIWHTGNLDLIDDGTNLYHLKQYKVYKENYKPDVDRGDVINAASTNNPEINGSITISGTSANANIPRIKLKNVSKEAILQYKLGHLNFVNPDGADIIFPNVSGTVITTGNYPTWRDIGGNDYLVQNGSSEIKPNNKHFVTASSDHHILPFRDSGSQIGENGRRFNRGYFKSIVADTVNGTCFRSPYNSSSFITFDHQSGFTHTRISGASNVKASDIILGHDDNYSKSRNIVLNKPLVHSSGAVIIDSEGKLDFNNLKNNNKVDKSGDTLTGNLLFDGTRSTQIEFKTDNQRAGSIKSTTSLTGQNYSNEIVFTNNSGLDFKVNNKYILALDMYKSKLFSDLEIDDDHPVLILKSESSRDTEYARPGGSRIVFRGRYGFRPPNHDPRGIVESRDDDIFVLATDTYTQYPKAEFSLKSHDPSSMQVGSILVANEKRLLGIGDGQKPEDGYTLTSNGKIQAKSEIDSSSNDYTVATTKWVRSTAISEIDTLKRSISTNGVQTTQVTVSDKYNIVNGSNRAELKYNGSKLEITNNQSGDLYYNGRLVYDSNTIPQQSTSIKGIVKLNDTYTSTSTTEAATANSVKVTYDFADTKVSKSGDTMSGPLKLRRIFVNGSLYLTCDDFDTNNFAVFQQLDDRLSITNNISHYSLQLHNDERLTYGGCAVYHEGKKPRFDEIWDKPTKLNEYSSTFLGQLTLDRIGSDGDRPAIKFKTGANSYLKIKADDRLDGNQHRSVLFTFDNAGVEESIIMPQISKPETVAYQSWVESNFATKNSVQTLLGNVVDTRSEQEISGSKRFRAPVIFEATANLDLSSDDIQIPLTISASSPNNDAMMQITSNGKKGIIFSSMELQQFCSLYTSNGRGINLDSPSPAYLGFAHGSLKFRLGTHDDDSNDVRLHREGGSYIDLMSDHILGSHYIKAPDFYVTSDLRMKKDLQKIHNSLDKVKSLTGYKYQVLHNKNYVSSAGIIAQDLLKIEPTLVKEVDNSYIVNYNGIIAMLIEAIKELDDKVQKLSNNNSDYIIPKVKSVRELFSNILTFR